MLDEVFTDARRLARHLNGLHIAGRSEDGDWWTGGATGRRPEKRGWTVYARSTTIRTDPSRIDAGIAFTGTRSCRR